MATAKTVTSRAGSARAPEGFTLLELLVVLAVAGLIMSALPWAIRRALPAHELAVATQTLVGDLRRLRAEALATGEMTALAVESAGASYTLRPPNSMHKLPRGATATLRTQFAADTRELRFYPDGTSSGAQIDLELRDHRAQVTVDTISARIQTTP